MPYSNRPAPLLYGKGAVRVSHGGVALGKHIHQRRDLKSFSARVLTITATAATLLAMLPSVWTKSGNAAVKSEIAVGSRLIRTIVE